MRPDGRYGDRAAARGKAIRMAARERALMTKHDEGRRAFLVGTAIGAGAAATTALVPDALAEARPQQVAAADVPAAAPRNAGHGAFFNEDDSRTVAAFAERLMPGAPGQSGAADADVRNYIDLALAGAYADQQYFYRRGLAQLDAHCTKAYSMPFRRLTAEQQDETIAALEAGKVPEFVWPTAQAFFNTMRTHTMEGMFADPVYGGNKDFAGWRLVGFPGAQPIFTPADLKSSQAFTREPITGLQSRAKTGKEG
jgi:gluconate 2-dehydrogenase gamma chain